jgi:hypothetical protein
MRVSSTCSLRAISPAEGLTAYLLLTALLQRRCRVVARQFPADFFSRSAAAISPLRNLVRLFCAKTSSALLLAFVLANDFKIVPPEAPQSLDVITHPESCLSPRPGRPNRNHLRAGDVACRGHKNWRAENPVCARGRLYEWRIEQLDPMGTDAQEECIFFQRGSLQRLQNSVERNGLRTHASLTWSR